MKIFKIILVSFVFLGITSASYADATHLNGSVEKTINVQGIKSTNFSNRLKMTPAYSSSNYGSRSYKSSSYTDGLDGMDGALINATMGGMMNTLMMDQGGIPNNAYSNELMRKQQIEYAKQQAEQIKKLEEEDLEPVNNNGKKGFWDKVIDGL